MVLDFSAYGEGTRKIPAMPSDNPDGTVAVSCGKCGKIVIPEHRQK